MHLPKPDLSDLPADATPAERRMAATAWWIGYWGALALIAFAISGVIYLATHH